jgi:hypothetical protein
VPGFVKYKKGCTRLAAASDKVYQLLAHGQWFSPGTPASSTTTKLLPLYSRNMAESGIKHNKSIKSNKIYHPDTKYFKICVHNILIEQ